MNAAPVRAGSSDGFERFIRHCARYRSAAPRPSPRGVFKFRSLEEAQCARPVRPPCAQTVRPGGPHGNGPNVTARGRRGSCLPGALHEGADRNSEGRLREMGALYARRCGEPGSDRVYACSLLHAGLLGGRTMRKHGIIGGVAALGVLAGGLTACVSSGAAGGNEGGEATVTVLSGRADMVTGGDALLRVDIPPAVDPSGVRVTVNGADATAAFRPDPDRHRLVGLVEGLARGSNDVAVTMAGAAAGATLTLVNHPVEGPVFSGPHEQPFICETRGVRAAVRGDARRAARRPLLGGAPRRLRLPRRGRCDAQAVGRSARVAGGRRRPRRR